MSRHRGIAALTLTLALVAPDPAWSQDIRRGSGPGAPIAAPRRPRKALSVKRTTTAPRPTGASPVALAKADAHFKAGSDLLDLNKVDAAVLEFEQAIRINSKHAEAWAALGNALYNRADLDGALNAWQRAVSLDPTYYQVRANIANVYFARRDYDAAVKEYAELVAKMPNYSDALLGYGNSLVQLRRYEEAVPVLVRTIEASGGRNFDARLMLAQLHLYLKAEDKAEQYAREAIAEAGNDAPEGAPAWAILGFVLYGKSDFAGAEEAFGQAIKLCGGCPSDDLAQMYYNQSLALELGGKRMEAAKALDQYLQLAPFVENLAEHQKRLARLRQAQ